MMLVLSVVLVMLTTVQVFLGIFVEGRFASWSAEIIRCTFVIRFPLGCLFVNIHFTNRINCHWKPPLLEILRYSYLVWNPANRTSTVFTGMIVAEILWHCSAEIQFGMTNPEIYPNPSVALFEQVSIWPTLTPGAGLLSWASKQGVEGGWANPVLGNEWYECRGGMGYMSL